MQSDDRTEQLIALARQVDLQAEAAKRAISEYKRVIRRLAAGANSARARRQRDVELAVARYVRLRKQLEELRARGETPAGEAS